MKNTKAKNTTEAFKQSLAAPDESYYTLSLYVTGMTSRSTRAITNIKPICEEHLKGRCDLRVLGIYQQPVLAQEEQIIAAPTLIKKLPLPLRRFFVFFDMIIIFSSVRLETCM